MNKSHFVKYSPVNNDYIIKSTLFKKALSPSETTRIYACSLILFNQGNKIFPSS